jgi:hypothetical protein
VSEPSTPGPGTLEQLVGRLEAAAGRLRGGGLAPEEAAELVEECARSAAEASAELERRTRAGASDADTGPPAQGRLV